MREELVYHESQRFRQWWLIALVALVNAPIVYGCFRQLVFGIPWGDKPMSDLGLIVFTVIMLAFTVGLLFLRLDVVISKEGVSYRMLPMRWSFIPWENMASSKVDRLNMLKYTGGPKISFGLQSKSYVMSGKYALQITMKSGWKIILGTRMPKELAEFLDKLNAERKQK